MIFNWNLLFALVSNRVLFQVAASQSGRSANFILSLQLNFVIKSSAVKRKSFKSKQGWQANLKHFILGSQNITN